MTLWIKKPLSIMADGAEGGIVVDGARIVELVGKDETPSTPIDETFDASEHVVMPGLINTHHHFYQTLARAFRPALDKELFDWLTVLYPVWATMNPEGFRLASRVAMAELMLSGCTTAVDHHYVFPAGLENAIDIQMEEADGLGLRVALCRGSMDLSVEDGGLPPKHVTQSIDTILADCERVVGRWHERGEGAMKQVVLAPCSPFSVSSDLMRESSKLADKLDVRLHTHLAEVNDETTYCQEHFGMRPLDYAESLGWLSGRVWVAHGIFFTDDEMRRMGEVGMGVAHCPTSNMITSAGTCQPKKLESFGAPVGLAVDGAGAQDCSNLIQEARQAFLMQRTVHGISSVTHTDPLRWATEGSAGCLGRPDLGRIELGKQADLAMFKLDELRFSGFEDPLAALVICGAHHVDRLMIAGRWRVEDGAIPGLDIHQLMHDHQQAARRVQEAA